MNKLKKYLQLFIFLSWSQGVGAYILNQTKSGIPVHWPSWNRVVDIYVNSQNGQGLLENEVQSIASNSINQWNGNSKISLNKKTTTGKDQPEFNELYFSNDPNIFGNAVIGVTQVAFKEDSGEIITADILINDNFQFSLAISDQYFLGNVITHEVGHFLGLGHGPTAGSTMFHEAARGQYEIDDDDKAGIYTIYPTGNPNIGTITGTIIGGKNVIPVFGSYVQAISVKTGKIMGASISESNGKFSIGGLAKNDQYIIYNGPVKQLGLPANYANVRSDYCESSKKYRGSFFQSCGGSAEGFPEAVGLNASSVDVGNITIRCGLDSPPEYLQKKKSPLSDFNLNQYTASGIGGSFVGFFSSQEISQISTPQGTHDFFHINLSHITDWDVISLAPLYLELKVVNQSFYSVYKNTINVTRKVSSFDNTRPSFVLEKDGRPNIDSRIQVPINRVNSSDNDFSIQITPESLNTNYSLNGIDYTKSDFFPSTSKLEDNLYFYLVIATIVQRNPDGSFTQVASKNDLLSDNSRCPDAINTYALTNFTAKGVASNSERKKVAGCGTVDFDNAAGGGPGGFMVGIILTFIISYALSRYSKMA